MISAFAAVAAFAAFNVAGALLLRARGFGLISWRKPAAPPRRWRAPVARLFGPVGLYIVACGLAAVAYRYLEVPTTKIEVAPGFPAEAAGLKTGDRVVQVAGAEVRNFPELRDRIAAQGRTTPVEVVVLRGEARVTTTVTIDAEGRIGVRPSSELTEITWGVAIAEAWPLPIRTVAATVRNLANLLSGRKEVVVAGPVAVMGTGARPQVLGFASWFAASLAFWWVPLTLLALATQVVAWRRGELRAPAQGGG